jgi:CheY-specific phosphatase CheX
VCTTPDRTQVDACLHKATVETLELMCFTAAETSTDSILQPSETTAKQIEFTGDAHGQLCVAMEVETARLLAANFYGSEPESLEDVQVEALVAELTNVVCGGMLSLLSPAGSFTLSSPEPRAPAPTHPGALDRAFVTDCGKLVISVECG